MFNNVSKHLFNKYISNENPSQSHYLSLNSLGVEEYTHAQHQVFNI